MHTQNAGRSFDMVESIWDVRLLTRVPRRASQMPPGCRGLPAVTAAFQTRCAPPSGVKLLQNGVPVTSPVGWGNFP